MPINKEFGIVGFVLLENTSLIKVFPADISTIAKIGVEKARKHAGDADLILYVVDSSVSLDESDEEIIQMISDKVSVVSTDKVFSRIKDVVDLYYLSKVFSFDHDAVMHTLENNGKTLDSFNGFLNRYDDLRHSYDKFRFTGDVSKPPFDEMYKAVKEYIKSVLPKE